MALSSLTLLVQPLLEASRGGRWIQPFQAPGAPHFPRDAERTPKRTCAVRRPDAGVKSSWRSQ